MPNFPETYRSPLRELSRLQRQIDRMFEDMSGFWPVESRLPLTESAISAFSPACDIEETNNHYLISFDLPGVRKEDIRVELVGEELRVSGERRQEHEEKTRSRYRMERSYGSFQRTFTLPSAVKPEQIETEYSEGVLRIAVPKVPAAKAQPIKLGEGKPGLLQRLLGTRKEEPKKAA